jgi:hypothetical protein
MANPWRWCFSVFTERKRREEKGRRREGGRREEEGSRVPGGLKGEGEQVECTVVG